MAFRFNYQYNPADTQQQDDALQRLSETRQRMLDAYTSGQRANKIAVQQEADRMRKEKFAQDINAQSSALKGAQLGSAAGPWGALAGGVIGLGAGMKNAYDARKKRGDSTWTAFRRTAGNVLNPIRATQDLFGAVKGDPGAAATVAGTLGKQVNKKMTAQGPQRATAAADSIAELQGRYDAMRNMPVPGSEPASSSSSDLAVGPEGPTKLGPNGEKFVWDVSSQQYVLFGG